MWPHGASSFCRCSFDVTDLGRALHFVFRGPRGLESRNSQSLVQQMSSGQEPAAGSTDLTRFDSFPWCSSSEGSRLFENQLSDVLKILCFLTFISTFICFGGERASQDMHPAGKRCLPSLGWPWVLRGLGSLLEAVRVGPSFRSEVLSESMVPVLALSRTHSQ